jgi:hypothetical protein
MSKIKFKNYCQSLFSDFSKGINFENPNAILLYAIKPFKQNYKVFIKILLCFENLFSYCSEMLI